MTPEVEAAIVRVAGEWATSIQDRYSAPRQPESLRKQLLESFQACYRALHDAIEPRTATD